jgi:predicted flavoprotein YhiN
MSEPADIVVIGAGAAGIFAAWRASQLGARVVLVEKTNRIGTKILISGGGKCNVAHAGPLESVLSAFRSEEARFIRPACYKMTNARIVELMEEGGLRVYTRPDGRVFPVDQTAKDVVTILESYLDSVRVEVRLESPVQEILAENGRAVGIRVGQSPQAHRTNANRSESRFGAKALLAEVLAETVSQAERIAGYELRAKCVVIACGGSSYPKSGTTGDGWVWARRLGHTIVKPRAALAPIYLCDPVPEMAGVAVRDCTLRARLGRKEVAKASGDLLFTHQGVSGPNVLAASRAVAEALESGSVELEIDLLPAVSNDRLAATYLEWLSGNSKKSVRSSLEAWAPNRICDELCARAGVPSDLACAKLERKTRNRLLELLKFWPIGKVRSVPIEWGEVVAGGISRDEVDPKSMKSKIVEGMFVCGEALDVAGPVGGYNLQAAFATGYLAGEAAASEAMEQ